MTTREEIEKQLTAAREALEVELGCARNARFLANENIKSLRAALEALPKLAVKRTRRAKGPRVIVDGVLIDDSGEDGLCVTNTEREAHAAEQEFES